MLKNQLFDLSNDESLISISGKDASTFLQGQITCDINSLTEENHLYGSLCNPKGRVISLFYIFKRLDVFFVVVPKSLSDVLVKRLKMFVFRSKVEIQDVNDNFIIYGDISTADNAFSNSFKILTHSTNQKNSLIIFEQKYLKSFKIEVFATISNGTSAFYLQLIEAGVPRITSLTSELFIPQTLNLDLLDGISFTKGCYTGQEIIARLHYKGSVKRRMYYFEATNMIQPGTDLFISGESNSLGTIVDCQPTSNQSYAGTAVIKDNYSTHTSINCDEFGKITIKPIKYS
ncbi:MAG: hypothetical protein COB22_06265 [Cycloclasticus sp.]|nr:MAG: hypothetical protein COB22_06265 [Cycloclasticus sp.]